MKKIWVVEENIWCECVDETYYFTTEVKARKAKKILERRTNAPHRMYAVIVNKVFKE